jgi:hypothetical protein
MAVISLLDGDGVMMEPPGAAAVRVGRTWHIPKETGAPVHDVLRFGGYRGGEVFSPSVQERIIDSGPLAGERFEDACEA